MTSRRRARFNQRFLVCLALLAVAAHAGCGDGGDDGRAPGDRSSEVVKYSASDLPPLGDYLPVLDKGRVELAPPQDWRRMGRKAGYVAIFHRGNPNSPPRILVTVEEADSTIDAVTPENLGRFVEQTAERLREDGVNPLEPPRPLLLAGEPWVRYVLSARKDDVGVEQQILQRVVSGRMYTVRLDVYSGRIRESRDAAYAVAAGMRFPQAEQAADEQTPTPPADEGSSSSPSP